MHEYEFKPQSIAVCGPDRRLAARIANRNYQFSYALHKSILDTKSSPWFGLNRNFCIPNHNIGFEPIQL